jgi:hypothetical protein
MKNQAGAIAHRSLRPLKPLRVVPEAEPDNLNLPLRYSDLTNPSFSVFSVSSRDRRERARDIFIRIRRWLWLYMWKEKVR